MRIVNIHEAKTHFSKLVDAVIHGKEIIIAMAGKPVAKLAPIEKKKKRPLGLLKGKIKTSKGFYDPLPEDIIAAFEGDV
jgi:prevent-host-death family protein